jgi:hypothetical protein
MRTRESLVNRIAKLLRISVAGEALGAVEFASINDEIPSLVATLNSRGVVYIPDVEEIEDDIFDPLARVLASRLCTDLGVTLGDIPGFETEPMRSEMELRSISRSPSVNDVIPFVRF